jgi:uncharacterized protein YjiS (DUF1127 family)
MMSTIFSAPTATQDPSGPSWMMDGLVATLKRWWVAYVTWRIERATIVQLSSMSDHALKDIGLTRPPIPRAVIGETAVDRPFQPL